MKKLKNIKGLLSRDEMRQVQGGSGTCGSMFSSGCMGFTCCSGLTCQGYPGGVQVCL